MVFVVWVYENGNPILTKPVVLENTPKGIKGNVRGIRNQSQRHDAQVPLR